MRLGRKKTFIDHAGDYVDSVRPQVESALATAKERAIPLLNDAKDKAGPVLADARERAKPLIADGAAYAADKAAIVAEIASQKASEGAALAQVKAAEGRDLAAAKVAELKGEKPKKKHRFRKIVLFSGLAAAAAFVAKKLSGGSESKNWQSSYTPAPPPAPRPAPTPAAPQSGASGDDEGGASPDEALADAAQGAHASTTPDDPADEVVVDEGADEEINKSGSHKA